MAAFTYTLNGWRCYWRRTQSARTDLSEYAVATVDIARRTDHCQSAGLPESAAVADQQLVIRAQEQAEGLASLDAALRQLQARPI